MKPHKHAELIKAWADGAEIQVRAAHSVWTDCASDPAWRDDLEYRIKPRPVPDVIADVYIQYVSDSGVEMYKAQTIKNLRLHFNYYTGELKSAEVLK